MYLPPGAVDRTRSEYFPLFNALRALAALSVFAFHAVYQIAVTQPHDHLWYRLGVQLDVGVPMFFALSGFLLYRPFLSATLRGTPVSARAYAWRRFLRIVPAYWVALAAIAIWLNIPEVKSVAGALRFGLFAQVYSPDTALRGIGQAWTLDVEMAFYVLLPILALGLVRARSARQALVAVGAVIAAGLAWNALALTQADAASPSAHTWLLALPAQLDQLGVGMLLAVLSLWTFEPGGVAHRARALVERRPWVPWSLAGAAFLLCGAVSDYGLRAGTPITDKQYLVTHVLRTAFAGLVLLPAVFGGHTGGGFPRRLLAWRPLAYVGTVSYSFYLWHYAVVVQQARWWDGVPHSALGWIAWTAAALAGGLVVASLSYYAVERPFLALRRLVPDPQGRQSEAAQARAAP